jgi:hypothetical protein
VQLVIMGRASKIVVALASKYLHAIIKIIMNERS